MKDLLPSPLPPFLSLPYNRPDVHRFSEEARRTKNHYQKWNKARNLREASQRFQEEVDTFNQAAVLAHVHALLEPSSARYREECAFFETVLPTVERLVDSVTGWLRQKSSSPELKDFFGSSFLRKTQTAHLPYQKSAAEAWEREQEAQESCLLAASAWLEEERSLQRIQEVQKQSEYSAAILSDCPVSSVSSDAEQVWLTAYEAWISRRRILSQEWGFEDVLEECLARHAGSALQVDSVRRFREGICQYFAPMSRLPWPEDSWQEQWSLDFSDWIYGLNSLCNNLGLQPDWMLQLERAGYIRLDPKFEQFQKPQKNLSQEQGPVPNKEKGEEPERKKELVQCFYLPETRLPYLYARISPRPESLYRLLGETGRCYAFLRAAQQFSFTPFVEWDEPGGDWIAQSFLLASLSQVRVFLGSKADRFQEWAGICFVRKLLETACLDAFQDRLFSELHTANDIWPIWDSCSATYFPSWNLVARREVLRRAWEDERWIREPFATTERLLSLVSALSFWDVSRTQPEEAMVAWDLFCQGGSRETLIPRVRSIGLPSPLEIETLKRLAYQLCFALGY